MQNFYLVRWLKENSGLAPDIIDSLKFELDKRIYYYGAHFACPAERSIISRRLSEVKTALKETLLPLKKSCPCGKSGGGRISSNAYFNFNAALTEQGFSVFAAPWHMRRGELGDAGLYYRIQKINSQLEKADFKDLLTREFAADVLALKAGLKEYYLRADISALVVPFDLPFFERLAINIFKELGRPSFISLHGLPGRYNNVDDNRTDYLLVWGEKIKEFYVRAGISPEKIFVTGHPAYRTPLVKKLRFSLDDVLVVSKAMGGAQHSAEEILSDRGNLMLYLYSMHKALEKAGVRKVRLRLHPSESRCWYKRFLDGDFFVLDKEDLAVSLGRASLVVGPTSTLFVESLVAGVNYLIYEPALGGRDMVNYPLVPPFDGTEPGIPAAKNEEELSQLLLSRCPVAPSALGEFIKTPFDISFLKNLIPGKV
jgi:hypothetical protein